VATLVQLLRANTDVRLALAASRNTVPGDRVWNSLSALLMAMDSQADTGRCLTELIRAWRAEGILQDRAAGVDPAEVLLRLIGRPGAMSEELRRLVSFTHRRRSSCPNCGREDTVATPQSSFVASTDRSLQSQVHRLTRGTRSCTCGGTSHDGQVAWSSLGAVLLVQGNSPFSRIPVKLRMRVASHGVDLALVAVFEHHQAHHRLYLRSQRVESHGGWWLFDDDDVRPMGRTALAGEDMFRQSETSERSTFWVYARQAIGNLHAYNIGLHQPCGMDCGEGMLVDRWVWTVAPPPLPPSMGLGRILALSPFLSRLRQDYNIVCSLWNKHYFPSPQREPYSVSITCLSPNWTHDLINTCHVSTRYA
jgi:hypothetical protein